ncbi:MAG: 5'-deoxynucleotidase [Clostridiaceae bacterium]|nr:5'-deoxynucleotidase [Clostridiaceae bacterium]
MNHFFAYVFRMRHILRWSLMRNAEEENLSEHTAEVAMLAHALALIRRDVLGRPCDPDRVAALALYHDAPETMTGDLPTPVKYANPRIRHAFGEIEEAARDRLLAMLPPALRPEYAGLFDLEHSEYYDLVKAADRLAAYIKCKNELKTGNEEFRRAYEKTRASLDGMDMPEVSYFMQEFMPSFALNLHDMTDA